MRFTWALVAVLWCQGAAAQTSSFGTGGQHLSVEWTHPTEDDGGRLDCREVQTGCRPMSAASCDGDARPLEVFLRETTVQVPVDSRLFVWLTSGTCTFTAADKPADVLVQILDSTDPLVSGGEPDFEFPADFEPAHQLGTVEEILATLGACDADGLDQTTYRICFGVSIAASGSADDAVSDSEPNGYVEFVVDTVPPGPPSVAVTPRDRRLTLEVDLADSTSDDLDHWIVRYRPAADPNAASSEPCDGWPSATDSEPIEAMGDDGSATLEVEVRNSVTYELCVFAVDHAGNLGEVSSNVLGTAQDECDFYECFPGEPPSGYCGAGLGSLEAALSALAALALRLRRRSS